MEFPVCRAIESVLLLHIVVLCLETWLELLKVNNLNHISLEAAHLAEN